MYFVLYTHTCKVYKKISFKRTLLFETNICVKKLTFLIETSIFFIFIDVLTLNNKLN